MIRAVIFDLDGVLIDSRMLHFEAWKIFWKKRGIKYTYQDFMKYFGISNFDIFPMVYKDISKAEIKKLSEEKESYYIQTADKNLKPSKGAKKLLEELRSNSLKIALGTSAPSAVAKHIIEHINFRDFFDAIISGNDVKRSKPSPDIFLKAAKTIGASPKECVVIEDSIPGIEAAKNAGMRCIAVATTHKAGDLKIADLVAKDLSKVSLSQIRGLNG